VLHGVGPTPVAPYMRDGPFAPCPQCFTMVRHADRLQDDEPSQNSSSTGTSAAAAGSSDSGSGECACINCIYMYIYMYISSSVCCRQCGSVLELV
jgi:hypothetical protein